MQICSLYKISVPSPSDSIPPFCSAPHFLSSFSPLLPRNSFFFTSIRYLSSSLFPVFISSASFLFLPSLFALHSRQYSFSFLFPKYSTLTFTYPHLYLSSPLKSSLPTVPSLSLPAYMPTLLHTLHSLHPHLTSPHPPLHFHILLPEPYSIHPISLQTTEGIKYDPPAENGRNWGSICLNQPVHFSLLPLSAIKRIPPSGNLKPRGEEQINITGAAAAAPSPSTSQLFRAKQYNNRNRNLLFPFLSVSPLFPLLTLLSPSTVHTALLSACYLFIMSALSGVCCRYSCPFFLSLHRPTAVFSYLLSTIPPSIRYLP